MTKHTKRPSFVGIEIGNSLLVPLDRSLVKRLKINIEETVFEQEIVDNSILLKIKTLHTDSSAKNNDQKNMNEND